MAAKKKSTVMNDIYKKEKKKISNLAMMMHFLEHQVPLVWIFFFFF